MAAWASSSDLQQCTRPDTHVPRLKDAPSKIVVLSGPQGPSNQVLSICQSLELNLIHADSHHDLPFALHNNHPMAVIFEIDPQSLASRTALRMIAAFDQDLPVLLVTGDDPVVLGTIDAAQELWQLSGLTCLPTPPKPNELIHFLYRAGRQCGSGRLMPIT